MNSAAVLESRDHLPGPLSSSKTLTYALVTPARNEAAFIEQTIRSVIAQTAQPRRWIIVSDGSTDGTDEIVQRYAREHDWIELLRMPERPDRQFAAKAQAFNAGYAHLSSVLCPLSSDSGFDIIGNLDADITFGPDYFEFLLSKFQLCPELGVAGTPFVEDHDRLDRHSYAHQFANSTHVSGGCQMFRKKCFEEIGGYVPVKAGAIDWIAVTTARMKGWQTRTFTEKVCFHHRKLGVGSGSHGKLRMRFHYGRKAYYVGGHPLWECLRGLFQVREKPFVLGGVWFIAGYVWAALHRSERTVSPELMRFHRAEQMARLQRVFARRNSEPRQMADYFETNGKAFTINRRGLIRLCSLRDEYYEFVQSPEEFVSALKRKPKVRADLFTFIQEITETSPKFRFHQEWDSAAVLSLSSYEHWWKKQINDKTRNMIRKAQKSGVEIRPAEFSDELVRGIELIYNESPMRQGRRFTHYAKDFHTIRREHATFLHRSEFFGAYHDGQLIGFIKLVHGRGVSSLMNIIAMISQRNKAPTNALIAKAVEVCTEKGVPLLQYGTGNSGSIGDFKKHHAFADVRVPRYFIPLNFKGALLLKLGFHRQIQERIPKVWRDRILAWRSKWNSLRMTKTSQIGAVARSAEPRAQA